MRYYGNMVQELKTAYVGAVSVPSICMTEL